MPRPVSGDRSGGRCPFARCVIRTDAARAPLSDRHAKQEPHVFIVLAADLGGWFCGSNSAAPPPPAKKAIEVAKNDKDNSRPTRKQGEDKEKDKKEKLRRSPFNRTAA